MTHEKLPVVSYPTCDFNVRRIYLKLSRRRVDRRLHSFEEKTVRAGKQRFLFLERQGITEKKILRKAFSDSLNRRQGMKNFATSEPDKVRPVRVTGLTFGKEVEDTVGSPISIAQCEVHEPNRVSTPSVKQVQLSHDKVGGAPDVSKAISFKKLLKSLTPKRMRSWIETPCEYEKKRVEAENAELPGCPGPDLNDWNDNDRNGSDVVVFERVVSSWSRSNASSRCGSRGSSGTHSVHECTQRRDGMSERQICGTADDTLCRKNKSHTTAYQECIPTKRGSGNSTDTSNTTAVRRKLNGCVHKLQGPPCVPILSFNDFLAGNIASGQSQDEPQTESKDTSDRVVQRRRLSESSEECMRFGNDEDDEEECGTSCAQSNTTRSGDFSDELTQLGSLEAASGEGVCRRLVDMELEDGIDDCEVNCDVDEWEEEPLVF